MAALMYVRRMRRMNLAGNRAPAAAPASAAGAAEGLAATLGLNWDSYKTFGQGLTSLTKGQDQRWVLGEWSITSKLVRALLCSCSCLALCSCQVSAHIPTYP